MSDVPNYGNAQNDSNFRRETISHQICKSGCRWWELRLAVIAFFEFSGCRCRTPPFPIAYGPKTHHFGQLDATPQRCRCSMCRSDPKSPKVSRWIIRTDVCCRREISRRNYHRKWLVVHTRQQASPEQRPNSGSLLILAECHNGSAREVDPQARRILIWPGLQSPGSGRWLGGCGIVCRTNISDRRILSRFILQPCGVHRSRR